ncbi:GTP pyrophosphokinase family protein [Ferruginibacter yonginensis]|uniref:GTP pyrophosphokinase family protein n=1 Tax=Ferruginibacter yonginensis TaxID=1310416 RepID=A0ABV8QS36_9BACT
MDTNQVSYQYSEVIDKYQKLGQNIVQALELFLNEKEISFLSIYYRVKDKNSFLEKIERKKYESPFEQIEDICGVRIICYYQNDVQKIAEIIKNEFEILENEDKENLLNTDQFGYRSTHFIAKIKPKWLQAPNYRGLENLKTEIQVRTVLMHSWAEIEHKLAYKKDIHIPKELKRKLYRISAKLEEADEQFEELKNSIIDYRNDVTNILNTEDIQNDEIDLNLDSLQSFLDLNFPERVKNIEMTSDLVDEFSKFNISLSELKKSYKKVKNYLPEIEIEIFKDEVVEKKEWVQVGIARNIMDLTNENYRENRNKPENVKELDRFWAEKIKQNK